MDRIAVLIPCLNEAETIGKVVADFRRALPEAAVYVYDNASSDSTVAAAREAGAIVRHEPRRGKGNVVRRMFLEIEAESYVLVDGDDTYPAEASVEMVAKVLDGQADMVIGDRLSSTYGQENTRRFHEFGNSLVRAAINRLFGNDISDVMTGYRAMSHRFVKSFPVVSTGFEIETEMTIHAVDKNMGIDDVVVSYRDRPQGTGSKLRTLPDGARVLRTIAALYRDYRPMRFFGTAAAVLFVVSTLFLVPVVTAYFETGFVERFPTLIACGFGFLSGILAFCVGLVLEAVRNAERRQFEFRLQEIGFWSGKSIGRD